MAELTKDPIVQMDRDFVEYNTAEKEQSLFHYEIVQKNGMCLLSTRGAAHEINAAKRAFASSNAVEIAVRHPTDIYISILTLRP